MGDEKIKAAQFKKMVFLFTVGTSIILAPNALASDAKNDAWISAIIGMAAGFVLVGLYLALAKLVPGRTIVETCFVVLGKWPGMIGAFLIFLFSFVITSLVMRNLGDFLIATMFPETPIYALHLVYLLIILIGVRYGLSNIARTMDIFYPVVCVLFVLFVILLFPDIDLKRLQPVFGSGVLPIASATYSYISFPCLEYVLFLMILPKVEDSGGGGKAFYRGALLGGIVLITTTALCLLVMGAEMTSSNLHASFELAKMIKIGEFVQRVEVIIAVIWFITIFCKLILCFYMSVQSFSQCFQFGDYRPLVFPMGVLVFAVSVVIAPDIGYLMSFDRYAWVVYAFAFGLVMPLLLLLAALIKGRRLG